MLDVRSYILDSISYMLNTRYAIRDTADKNMTKMKKIVLMSLIVFLVSSHTVWTGGLTGRQVMDKVFYRDDGDDARFKINMVLIDKKGNKRERLLEIHSKDYDKLVKTFLEFIKPADINGTSFLTWENEDKDDTQYLYLPALGRARRIVSSQKNLKFVNTDFTYEDMQRRQPEKDEHKILGEENYNGYSCYLIESIPQKGTSQYSKRVSWIDKNSFVILKTYFYDKKGRKNKIFRVESLEEKSGIWTTMKTVMQDLKQKHTTLMDILEVEYNQGIDDGMFSLRKLEEE